MVKKVQKYIEGVGRRKTAVARVRLYEDKEKAGVMVDTLPIADYFGTPELISRVTAPLKATSTEKDLKVVIRLMGGGQTGQAEAAQLGIARALVKLNGDYHKALRDLDYLKRDPRKKERKKAGLKKARRSPQWAKR